MEHDESWDSYVKYVSEFFETNDNYQEALGKVASTVCKLYGSSALDNLIDDVEETLGRKINKASIRNYRWTYEKTCNLGLPQDINYSARQKIAGSGDPEYWAKKVINEGLSSAEVCRLILISKGGKKEKVIVCPHCEAEIKISQ